MKILQVTPFFSPEFGGSVTSVYILAKELAKRNHDVTIITSDYKFDKEYADTLEQQGLKVIPFHTVFHIGLFIVTPSMKHWLKKNIQNFDVIHMHNFRSYQNNIVGYYAGKGKVPFILQARGSVLPFFEKQLFKLLYDIIWGYHLLENASAAVALTPTEAQQYDKIGVKKEKIFIIPNGVDLTLFIDLPEKGIFRSRYGIPDSEKIVLYLGRIHKIKGIDLLVSAFAELLKEMDNITLVIAGPDDGYLSVLHRQIVRYGIEKKVIFCGPIFKKDKYSAFIDANIFILPSKYDAFPNTVIESLACGTPVIATTGCHIVDVVREAGIVVDNDQGQLKDAIITLSQNDDQAKKFGMVGKDLVFDKFSQEKIMEKVIEIYKNCMDEE